MRKGVIVTLLSLFAALGVSAQSQSSNTVNFQGVPPPAAPTIGTLTPGSGYIGNAVTIAFAGTNFASNCTATFNGVAVPFTFVSATSGSIAVPAGKVISGPNPIIVSCPLAVLTMNSPVQLPNAVVGQPYTADLRNWTAPACAGQCNFSLLSAPTWLTLSASGVIGGVPSSLGSASFTFTVTDSAIASAISRVHFILV